MANKHMKTCLASNVTSGMQIKTVRYHYTPNGMVKSRALTKPHAGEYVEKQELSFNTAGNAKWHNHLRRQSGASYKIKHTLSYDPAIIFLGIYPNESKPISPQKEKEREK